MTAQSSMFDLRPVALAREPEPARIEPSIPASGQDHPDVLRTITAKAGLFRELVDGKPSGREFSIIELHDGRFFWQYQDGSRAPATPATTRALVGDCIRSGEWREVGR